MNVINMDSSDSSSSQEPESASSLSTHTDTSVRRKKQQKRARHHLSSITAKQRAVTIGNGCFYADGDVLFCRPCSKAVDHSRNSTVKDHLKSMTHLENEKRVQKAKKQRTLFTTFPVGTPAKLENLRLVSAFVRTLAASKIPLNVSDNKTMKNFFFPQFRNKETKILSIFTGHWQG